MHVAVCASAHSQRVYLTPNRRRSIVFRVLFQQTNKHTNKHVCNDSLPHARGSIDFPLPPVPYLLSGRVLDGLTLTTAKKIAKRTSKLGLLRDGLLGPTLLFGCSPPAGPVIRLDLRHPRKKEKERKNLPESIPVWWAYPFNVFELVSSLSFLCYRDVLVSTVSRCGAQTHMLVFPACPCCLARLFRTCVV